MSDVVIGIETHVQLFSATKMFCKCASSFGDPPNTNVCPVCLGLPGALPIVNREATKMGIQLAMALGCKLNETVPYYRKNYFYPDLPKGYQITHYATPVGKDGIVTILVGNKPFDVLIHRIHLEEDAGKMFHSGNITQSSASLVDYNRCGAPLAEIVTEPCMENAEQAQAYLFALRNLVRFIGVSSGNMEEGALRCDVNISIRNPDGSFGTKVEVKNLNSFRSARRALEFEEKRQRELLAKGEKIAAETRHFNEQTGETSPMRTKEELNDYRYFPEPDIPPLSISGALLDEAKKEMKTTPAQYAEKFQKEYGLSAYDAGVLTMDKETTNFFIETIALGANPKRACNWLTVEIPGFLTKEGKSFEEVKITPKLLCEFVNLIESGQITNQSGKEILASVLEGKSPEATAKERNLIVVADEGYILELIKQAIEGNPNQLAQYKAGKTQLIGFFIGQVVKLSQGKAPAELVKGLLEKELDK